MTKDIRALTRPKPMGSVLEILLGDVHAGVLVREAGGRLRFLFDEQYAEMPVRPTLGPAYDLVSTIPYIPRDQLALGFGGSKAFRPLDGRRVKRFARAAQLPFEAVRLECLETAERTMEAWARHEQRDVLPRQIDKVVSTHMQSVALDMTRSMASRA